MSIIDILWNNVFVFLLVIMVLVFVHEWGHFWVARRNNVRVEVFSVGFGPELYGWDDKYGTRWKIAAIPLGGYVKMFGEGDERREDDDRDHVLSEEEKAVSFHYKTVGQRAAIVAAGPIVNFIFAIFAFAALAGIVGTAVPLSAVGAVGKDSAAAQAGFQKGDVITDIGGTEIKYFDQLREIVEVNAGNKLAFTVERGAKSLVLLATPKTVQVTDAGGVARTIGRLGVSPNPDHIELERRGPASALWFGVERTYYIIVMTLGYLGDIFVGEQGAEGLAGPIGIAQITGDVAKQGMENVINLMAMLSISLGLINLFPIPMLDGGHLAFYAIEAIRGKPLGEKAQEYGFRFGLVLVMMLFVFVTWNDIVRVISGVEL